MLSKQIARNRFGMLPTTERTLNLSVDHTQAQVVAFGANNMDQKFAYPGEKKDIFNTVASSKEINFPECELNENWEHSEKCGEIISMRDRLEQNKKNLEKRVEENGYILPFLSSHTTFMYQMINVA